MTTDDDDARAAARVRALIAEARRLALSDPDAAMQRFADAARLGASTGCDGVAPALEAMGRLAAARGDHAAAREALDGAIAEATARGEALVLARSRATRAALERPRAHADSAEALAAELRFVADLLDAAQLSLRPDPSLHAARARLELRRRLATPAGEPPAIGRVELALALDPIEMIVLAMCAALELEADADRGLPPAALGVGEAPWPAMIGAWLAPGVDHPPDVELALAALARCGLIAWPGGDRPALAPDVETLLGGRDYAVLPAGFARVVATPRWREGPAASPPGPARPPRLLAIVGARAETADHATQLAWSRGWPLWPVRPTTDEPGAVVRGIRAVAREALVHDRLIALALDGLAPETARLAVGEAAALVDRLVVLAPDRAVVEAITADAATPAAELLAAAGGTDEPAARAARRGRDAAGPAGRLRRRERAARPRRPRLPRAGSSPTRRACGSRPRGSPPPPTSPRGRRSSRRRRRRRARDRAAARSARRARRARRSDRRRRRARGRVARVRRRRGRRLAFRAWHRLGALARERLDPALLREAIDAALALAVARGDRAAEADLRVELAVAIAPAQPADARAELARAEALLAPGDDEPRSRVLGQRGVIAFFEADLDGAAALAREARALAVASNAVPAYLAATSLLVMIHERRGALLEALDELLRARASLIDLLGEQGAGLVDPALALFEERVGTERYRELVERWRAQRRAAAPPP